MNTPGKLKGKVVVVTGAAAGIGRASIPLTDGNSTSKRILGSSLAYRRSDGQSPVGIGEGLWRGRKRQVFCRLYRSRALPGSFWRTVGRASCDRSYFTWRGWRQELECDAANEYFGGCLPVERPTPGSATEIGTANTFRESVK